MQRKSRTEFTEDFKRQASQLASDLGSQKQAAKQLGVSEVNMHNWCKKYPARASAKNKGSSKTKPVVVQPAVDSSRLIELERENAMLRQVLAALTREYLSK